jgi:predicted MFS family arabinose efflux permease
MLKFYRQLFSGLPREVWSLSLVTVVHRSGTMVLPFLTLYLTTRHGFSAREAGGVLSLYGVGAIGGAYVGGWLSDRIGSIRAQLVGLCLSAGGLAVLSAMQSPFSIIVIVLLWSIIVESIRPANAVALAELSPPELHIRAFGLRRLAMNLGMSIGPALGGVLAAYSYLWLFFVEASVSLLAAGLLWALFQPQRHFGDRRRTDFTATASRSATPRSPWRDGVFLVLVGLVTLLVTVLCQLFGAYPLTLSEEYHLPEYTIGLVFTLNTLVIVVLQMPIIHAVERFDTLQVIGLGAFLLCAGFALLPLASSLGLIGVTVLVWTLGEMLTTPLLEGFVARRSSVESRGQYMGLFSSAFSMAFVLAPVGGNWVYEVWGYRTLWFLCGVLGVILWAAFSLLGVIVRKQHSPIRERQSALVR